jgi:predicted ATPase/DNA-binding CsgD family transcriptional regulator
MTSVSGREAEVLAALAAGLSNARIAGRLHISVRTVETHVSSLLRKYGVADRHALARLARPGTTVAPEPGHVTGLPSVRTSFVGRASERAALGDLRPGLVTLTGPGGVGKTRLAVLVAGSAGPAFPYGGAFVDLVPVQEDFVPQAAAAALGVAESPEVLDAIADRLGRGRSLLVLDNCEHVVDAVAEFVQRLLARCPDTTVLATSRERIGVPGERVVPVDPLPATDAVTLFRGRADADAGDAVIAELCARLDGMPLAIELAAARSASLGVEGLLTALDDSLRLLCGSRGTDRRHRSVRAVIGWSHDLLDGEERMLLRRLAVFAGPFDLTAAAAVDGRPAAVVADLLGRLTDKSLVIHRHGRWRLLATVRAFAAERPDTAGEPARTLTLVRRHESAR